MQVFKSKSELAKYLGVSRPSIDTKIKNKDIKQISIGNIKGYVLVKEFIIYLLK